MKTASKPEPFMPAPSAGEAMPPDETPGRSATTPASPSTTTVNKPEIDQLAESQDIAWYANYE